MTFSIIDQCMYEEDLLYMFMNIGFKGLDMRLMSTWLMAHVDGIEQ